MNNNYYFFAFCLLKSLISLTILIFISNSVFAAAPTQSASKVRITYTADANPANLIPIRILEGIEIWPASDERNITHYNVYWGDSMKNKLGLLLAPRLARIPAKYDGKKIVHEFPPGLKMEAGAIYVLVCTENNGQEYCGKANNMEKVTDPLIDLSNTLTSLKSLIYFNSSLPGVNVMETCGDLVCNGIETANSCPSDCSAYQYASFNFQVLCNEVKGVFHPRSIEEIKNLVKQADANGLRVKISSGQGYKTTSGSASSVVCTDGILLVMDQFDHAQAGLQMYLENFEGTDVVNVAAGTNLHELGEWLYQYGLGLGYVHLGWRHPSIAGAIGTSAHGSSPKHRGILAHSVVSMDVIGSDGELRTYSRGTTGVSDPDLWAALKTHLGYMGVITRLRIETQPATNTHVKITFHEEDELFTNNPNGSVYEDIKECDYGQYNWFPSLNQYLRTCGKTTSAPAENGANNALLDPYVDLSQLSAKQTTQVLQIGAVNPYSGANEKMEFMRRAGWHLTPILYKNINGQKRYTTNAVGPTHRMISSKLIDNLGREVFQMDWEVAIPADTSQAALEYIKSWSNGANLKNRNIPVPLIGIFVRFSKVEDGTLLAYTGAGNNFENGSIATHIEMPIFVPVGLNEAQMAEYMSPYEEAMKTLVTRYGARAHWGKNMYGGNPWIFKLQRDIGSYGDLIARFNQQVAKVDPNGMFANKYAAAIGIQYPNFSYPASWLPPGDNPSLLDTDNDGVIDSQDQFPNDATETLDSDGDGVGDNADAYPNDATRTQYANGSEVYNARFVRISAISEVNGYPYASAAEINLLDANAQSINRNNWVVTASNFESDTPASNAIDGNINTLWHTQWRAASPGHVHEFIIDMGSVQGISGLSYLPRQDWNSNGTIADYEIHFSNDGIYWGNAIIAGTLSGTSLKTIDFPTIQTTQELDSDGDGVADSQDAFPFDPTETIDSDGDGVGDNADAFPNDPTRTEAQPTSNTYNARYVRISALSEINGYPYASAAEINLINADGNTIDRNTWTATATNQEYDSTAAHAIDGNTSTIWHTEWRSRAPAHTHRFIIDMGIEQSVTALSYLPRQDGNSNGTFAEYEIHLSADGVNWGQALVAGTLSGTQLHIIEFPEQNGTPTDSDGDGVVDSQDEFPNDPSETTDSDGDGIGDNADVYPNDPMRSENNAYRARYIRISALSEVNGYPYSSAAEINFLNDLGQIIDRSSWTVTASNQEYDSVAALAVDGDVNTIWHTEWRYRSPGHTHSFTVDMGNINSVSALRYLPRQDGISNGNIARYEVFISNDGINWSAPVLSGVLSNQSSSEVEIPFL